MRKTRTGKMIALLATASIMASLSTSAMARGTEQQCENLRVLIMQTGNALSNGATEGSLTIAGLDKEQKELIHNMAVDQMSWNDGLAWYAEAVANNCLRYDDEPIGNYND